MPKNERNFRILWANSFCLLDTSSGASISIREILRQLSDRNFDIEILGATIFDSANGAKIFKELLSDSENNKRDLLTLRDGNLTHKLVKTNFSNIDNMTTSETMSLYNLCCKTLDSFKPDLLFFYGGLPVERLICREARIRKIPSVAYLVNPNFFGTSWCRDIDLIITDTHATSNYYKKREGFIPTPVGKFIDGSIKVKNQTRKYLTFVNPSWSKGAGIFALLALLLEKKRPDIKLEVVQSRGNWTEISKHISDLFDNDVKSSYSNVKVTAHTSNMQKVYQRSRVIFSPSLRWESGSRVLAEATLNGIPVMASKVGGNQEILGSAGLYFELPEKCLKRPYTALPSPKWFDSLIKVIEEFWDNEKFYKEYVSKSYETGKRYSDINGSVERIIKAFHPLLLEKNGDLDFSKLISQNHKQIN